jgi:very-short-patch-repair endonuclease
VPVRRALDLNSRCKLRTESADGLIASLGERQHGTVSRRQLSDLGLSRQVIDRRLATGRLHLIHRGVYAVGHPAIGREGRWMAAVLTAGGGAALSYRSAGSLWELLTSSRTRIDVTVDRGLHPRRGIELHRSDLAADEVTTHRRIPVTTVARTLLDLAAVLPEPRLERAINEAELRGLTDGVPLAALVERHPHRPGIPTVRGILADLTVGASKRRSDLEDLFRAFLRRTDLPRPEFNAGVLIDGIWIEPDCLWRAERVIVELDSHAFHLTPAAFESDRARDRRLQAIGWRVVRLTWRQIHDDPERLEADLLQLLRDGRRP